MVLKVKALFGCVFLLVDLRSTVVYDAQLGSQARHLSGAVFLRRRGSRGVEYAIGLGWAGLARGLS